MERTMKLCMSASNRGNIHFVILSGRIVKFKASRVDGKFNSLHAPSEIYLPILTNFFEILRPPLGIENKEVVKKTKFDKLNTEVNNLENKITEVITLIHINQCNTDEPNFEKINKRC